MNEKVEEWKKRKPTQPVLPEFMDTEELTENEKAEVVADWLIEKPGPLFYNARYKPLYPRRMKLLKRLTQIIQKESDLSIYQISAKHLEIVLKLRLEKGKDKEKKNEIRAEVYRDLASEMVSEGNLEMAQKYMDRVEELCQEDLEKKS